MDSLGIVGPFTKLTKKFELIYSMLNLFHIFTKPMHLCQSGIQSYSTPIAQLFLYT